MRTLIIAPHVDDETIGCWSVIAEADQRRYVTVAWNYELTDARVQEALRVEVQERIFGFDTLTPKVLETYDEIYVPSRKDWHKDHRETNARFRRYATHFYSVDMHQGKYLGEQESAAKREALDEWFPSQRILWEGDAKYYLFEDIQRQDFSVITTRTFYGMRAQFPRMYLQDVIKAVAHLANTKYAEAGTPHSRDLLDAVLSAVPYGRVCIHVTNKETIEVEN